MYMYRVCLIEKFADITLTDKSISVRLLEVESEV